jgi:hypothetical protein
VLADGEFKKMFEAARAPITAPPPYRNGVTANVGLPGVLTKMVSRILDRSSMGGSDEVVETYPPITVEHLGPAVIYSAGDNWLLDDVFAKFEGSFRSDVDDRENLFDRVAKTYAAKSVNRDAIPSS